MNRQQMIESAERLARLAAQGVKQCEKVSAILERKLLTLEEELAKVNAAFAEVE